MLHTLSNTSLFPLPQLLLPLTTDKGEEVPGQDAALFKQARPRRAGPGVTQPWKWL